MKNKTPLLALIALVFASCTTSPNALTPMEKFSDWKLLFDGATLNGWRSLKTEKPGAGWHADGGALVTPGKQNDIVTNDEFGDFELSLDWKISEGGNSGIIYRVGL